MKKILGDGDFEFTFMHNGELHTMRGRVKDATLHVIDKQIPPYVCTQCKLPYVDDLLDSPLDCFRPKRVFFEMEEDERGIFSKVRKVQDE